VLSPENSDDERIKSYKESAVANDDLIKYNNKKKYNKG
jgi:hypothetical protein